MIKNEATIQEMKKQQIEDFYVDGYHRRCLEEGEQNDYIDKSLFKLLEFNKTEFGKKHKKSSKHSNRFFDLIEEDDRKKYSELMDKLKEGGGIAGRIKYRIKTENGKILYLEENIKSLVSCS